MVRLPLEYQEVEYLESTGTQHILLPIFTVNLGTVGFEMKSMFVKALSGIRTMCATRKTWSGIAYSLSAGLTSYTSYRLITSNNGGYASGSGTDVGYKVGDICEIKVHGNIISYNDDEYPYTRDITGELTTPFSIFGSCQDSTVSEKPAGRCYYFRLFDGDALLFNGVSCYRKSDNEPGMYDTVSKAFYTNSGTGTFLVGNDVSWDTASLLERRRQILLNTPHIESVSGSMASFNTDISANLKECKVYFSPVQEGTGDPSPDNVRPISGWDGVTVWKANEFHRLKAVDFQTITYNNLTREYLGNGRYHVYGTLTYAYTTNPIYFEPFICPSSNGRKLRFFNDIAIGSNTNDFEIVFYNDSTLVERWTFNTANREVQNYTSMAGKLINNFKLTFGSYMVAKYVDFTFQPDFVVSPQSLTISFPKTIYGGYVDLVRGEVVEEYADVDMGDLTWNVANNRFYASVPNIKTTSGNSDVVSAWCEIYKAISYNNMIRSGGVGIAVNDTAMLRAYDPTYPTTEDFQQAVDGHIVVYPLATPNVYSLTLETIKTLKGINNIWSNANGNVEVSYYSH